MLVSLSWAPLSCGGKDDSIEGTWNRKLFENGKPCAEQLVLDHQDFVSTIYCDLVDKTVGTQITAGRYEHLGNRVTVTPKRSTCAGWPKDPSAWVVIAGDDRLTRTVDGVIYTFTRGGVDITANKVMGCFDMDFAFEKAPLLEL